MQAIAEACAKRGWYVVVTTTTKVMQPDGVVLIDSDFFALRDKIKSCFDQGKHVVTVGYSRIVVDSTLTKLVGIPPEWVAPLACLCATPLPHRDCCPKL